MESIFSSLVQDKTKVGDQTIATDMLAGSKSAAVAYLSATLESPTPELKAMYSDNLTQVINGHSALTKLAINKGWYKPYEKPEQQLFEAFDQSQQLINIKQPQS
ncbi:spore coat protein [Halanaerocella petrolearia]